FLTCFFTSSAIRLACATTCPVACIQQLLVALLQFFLSLILRLAAAGAGDLHYPVTHTPDPIADALADFSANLHDSLHRSCKNANPVSKQTAVGRIVNVGFRNRGVQS